MSINRLYLSYLDKHPLATKSATAAILATLNEGIATCVLRLNKPKTRPSTNAAVLRKILQMLGYAAIFATPVSHLYYKQLTRVFYGKLPFKLRVLQILTSLLTLSPFLSAAYVSWISAINSEGSKTDLAQRLRACKDAVAKGLKNNFWLVYRTSAITSTLAMAVAQAIVPPELWVVFFNLVYFVLGTYQNSKMKLRNLSMPAEKLD